MGHKIRPYDYEKDIDEVLLLMEKEGFVVEREEIGGVGAIATDDDDKIVGFIWALVGHSTIAYIGYLVVDRDLEDSWAVAVDLSFFILALLRQAGVKTVTTDTNVPSVKSLMEGMGWKLKETEMFIGNLDEIAGILTQYHKEKEQGNGLHS